MIYGTYQVKLSVKTNQITIPKPLLEIMGHALIAVLIPGRFFFQIYAKADLDAIVSRQLRELSLVEREAGFYLTHNSVVLKVDTQGRVSIPKSFCGFFQTADIVLESHGDHLRVWADDMWLKNKGITRVLSEAGLQQLEKIV